jgi:hypothetical protein
MVRNREQLNKTKPQRTPSNLTSVKPQPPHITPIRTLCRGICCFVVRESTRVAIDSNIMTHIHNPAAIANKFENNVAGICAFHPEVIRIGICGHGYAPVPFVGETDVACFA